MLVRRENCQLGYKLLPLRAVRRAEGSRRYRLLDAGRSGGFAFYLKRVMDMAVALALLVLLLPLLLLIAAAIRLDSAGPVLFVQERVGARRKVRRGKPVWEVRNFSIYKFRTMIHNADPSLHQAYIRTFVRGGATVSATVAADDAPFKLADDPRITRLGRFLRATSLDELPQLLNVVKGEMSLVGPRPVPVYEVAEYQRWHYERLAALPGITGLWQVRGRGLVDFDELVRMDISYVRGQSLWLDLQLLWLTIPAVLSRRGAK